MNQTPPQIPSSIQKALASLRSKIRWHVFWEGLLLCIIWLIAMFWIAFAIDYLPVKLGFSELNQNARIVVLTIVGLVFSFIFIRLILDRVLVPFQDRSLALLIERKFPEFNDSLITTVEAAERKIDDSFDPALLVQTSEKAERLIDDVDLAQVFNRKPLYRWATIAGVLLVSLGVFSIAKHDVFKVATSRLYGLSDQLWPRQCQIEIVGLKIQRENLIEGIPELGETLPMIENEFRVAKGSSVTLLVRAADDSEDIQRKLPPDCVLRYRTQDGNRGKQKLKRIGSPRNGFQLYSLDSAPLRGILADISFDIRGGDDRAGPFKIVVVEEPTVIRTEFACEFPEYMVDNESMRWTPRTIVWSGQSSLPQGTSINVRAKTNKPISKAYVYDADLQKMNPIETSGSQFSFEIPQLGDPMNLQFFLLDTDGIVSEVPHRISIEPIADQPPNVESSLLGIGTAVTADVRIPLQGTIEDDYGIAKQYIEIETPITETLVQEINVSQDGVFDSAVDLREMKQQSNGGFQLPVGGDNQIAVIVKAEDRFNLGDESNLGVGDRYMLDLVTPGQLLSILERLEVSQRRRLEQIYNEMSDARGYLVRARSRKQTVPSGDAEPGDLVEPEQSGQDSEAPKIRDDELRLLFTQRAIVQSEKSTQEIVGIAEAFDSIRLQLINNRVDSEDRKERLSEQIVKPLRLIADETMQQLKSSLAESEAALETLQQNPTASQLNENADQLTNAAIAKADEVLKQIDGVLSILVKYETQNELLDIVRKMIQNQKEISERTKKERKRKTFEGLLDDQ